ncbi:DNA-J related domain-containing protein [Paraglaciecola sp.]|uniref:DNA-J related domain-containing protein n=1 Tax=Paraglaciecola sp. TaxID=1920173 RepID=UPI003EF237C4
MTKQNTPSDWLPLQDMLRSIISDHPNGLSEYELLKILQSPAYKVFSQLDLQNPLVLFQTHFIVFNALYHLRDSLIKEQLGLLQIDCICIQIKPWVAGIPGLKAQDKLREYYLNWQHLSDTDQQQVENLLDSFWQSLTWRKSKQTSSISIEQALQLLELAELVDLVPLKKQYRKMLHKHHPDKGGDNEHTRLLHQAFESLRVYC